MNYQIIDNGGIPENISDADAEYFRIKISKCSNPQEAEKYRNQLALIENALLIAHNERVKNESKRKK